MDILERLPLKDREEFRRVANKLLSVCFLCRSRQSKEDRADYYFILRHRDLFREYFDVLGARLEISEEYGVIQLSNPMGYNRRQLRLYESVILLILRILYDEEKRKLSENDDVLVTPGDIQDKYLSLHLRDDKLIDKTTMGNALSLFRRYRLICPLDRDMTNEESRILIYDSIAMAVRIEDIKEAYGKLEIYRKQKGEKEVREENEEADQDETD